MGDQFDETHEMSDRDQSSFSRAISVRRGARPRPWLDFIGFHRVLITYHLISESSGTRSIIDSLYIVNIEIKCDIHVIKGRLNKKKIK